MGLDFVEAIIDIEEQFGISIPDEEASKLTTVGALTGYVLSRIGTDNRTRCYSGETFYRMRKLLLQSLPDCGVRIRPGSRLDEIVPEATRRRVWAAVRKEGLVLPRLELTRRQQWLCALAIATPVLLWRDWAGAAASFAVALAVYWGTRPWAIHPPVCCRTIRDVVLLAVDRNRPTGGGGQFSEREVVQKVRLIAAKQFRMPAEQITDDMDFTRDLQRG